jgi:hypothetical protein
MSLFVGHRFRKKDTTSTSPEQTRTAMSSKDQRAPPQSLNAHGRNPVKKVDVINFVHGGRNMATQTTQNWKCDHDTKVAAPGPFGVARIEIIAEDLRDAPFTVLAGEQLRRTRAELEHPCKRCAKSIAIGADCKRTHRLRLLLG